MEGVREEWITRAMSPYTRRFYESEVLARPLEVYLARLRAVGISGKARVLDAPCGLGQWSVAAARLNGHVEGIDISESRLLVANLLAQAHGTNNVAFRWAAMESLPFEAGSFDAVLSYNGPFYGDVPRALAEFYRLLKVGAPLYLTCNSYGWNLDFLVREGLAKRNPRVAVDCLQMMVKGALGVHSGAVFSRSTFCALVEAAGFSVEAVEDEGRLGEQKEGAAPFYPGRLWGLDAVFEVLARRR